jgi:hypothetical protein
MADPGYVKTLANTLAPDVRRVLGLIGEYILGNLKLGRPTHQTRATNLQAYHLTGTTHAVANTEFSIVHGLNTAPYLLVPVLDLQTVGAKTVDLTVSRAADANRVYLKSSQTAATFNAIIEG